MEIIRNEIHIGADKEFRFLHMSDTHLTHFDETESEERIRFALMRRNSLFIEADDNIAFVEQYVSKTRLPLIHTGDLYDFITPENLRTVKKFADHTGALIVAGNHEIQHCPNNVFSEVDFLEEIKHHRKTLHNVQGYFNNDICFFCKEINGVYLVGIDNSAYGISEETFKKLQEVVSYAKPIILFMHIPMYSKEVQALKDNLTLAAPEEVVHRYSDFKRAEQQADLITRQICEFIKEQPLIKCIFSGHLHLNYETKCEVEKKQFITGLNTLREVTVT